MKKLFLFIIIAAIFTSCSIDDENTTFTKELVPAVSVELPDTLLFRQNHTFTITYKRPTSCHVFNGFSLETKNDTLFIGVVNAVYPENNCETLSDEEVTKELNFFVERNDFYIFKFWQGLDEAGNPFFLTKEVPVRME